MKQLNSFLERFLRADDNEFTFYISVSSLSCFVFDGRIHKIALPEMLEKLLFGFRLVWSTSRKPMISLCFGDLLVGGESMNVVQVMECRVQSFSFVPVKRMYELPYEMVGIPLSIF